MFNQLHRRFVAAAGGCVFATALLLYVTAEARVPGQGGVFAGRPLPPIPRLVAHGTMKFGTTLRATAHLDCEAKQVTLCWKYAVGGTFEQSDASVLQIIATSFWPTAADVVADNKLIVAGKERLGGTRIEVWTVAAPIVEGAASTPGQPVAYTLKPKSLDDITEIYSQSTVGQDIVRGIIKLRGPGTKALVHFQDSKSLFQIDWGTSPYPISSLLSTAQEPLLSNAYELYTGGNHVGQGYVYTMSIPDDFGLTPCLILKDTNRDGVIDWHGTMTSAQYLAAGLGDLTQYTEYGNL